MAIGGMVSILGRGTAGGMPMNLAFTGYGLALLICALVIALTTTLIAIATWFAARDFWLPVTLALFRSG